MARFKKGSKEAKAYMAKIRKAKTGTAKKAKPIKKVSGLEKVVRKGKKTAVHYSRVSGVTDHAVKNLNYLVKELETAEKNYNVLKHKKKTDSDWPAPGYLEMYKRYPLYIRSLKKQITEAKKNIK